MMRALTCFLLSFVLLGACERHPRSPADRSVIALVQTVPVAPGAEVSPGAFDDCDIQGMLLEEIVDEGRRDFAFEFVATADVSGRTLALRFTRVRAVGGGAITGPKTVVLEGRLLEGGTVVASFTGQRTTIVSKPPIFGSPRHTAYKFTCGLIEQVLEELAEDITDWLKQPTMDARLGELARR